MFALSKSNLSLLISKLGGISSDKNEKNFSFLVMISLNPTTIRVGTLFFMSFAELLYSEILLKITIVKRHFQMPVLIDWQTIAHLLWQFQAVY